MYGYFFDAKFLFLKLLIFKGAKKKSTLLIRRSVWINRPFPAP